MRDINYVNSEEQNYSMFCHLSALAGYIIPFGNIIGPLIVWLMKRDQYAEVNRQGKDSLNFQISMAIYIVISVLLIILVVGIFLLIALALLNLILVIVASVKAANGERFSYPLTIQIIR